MSIRTQEKYLEFFLRFRPNCPSRLIGDPGRIRQILFNLCSNAIKFTEKGHVLLDVSAEKNSEGKLFVSIAVSDTGIGISSEKMKAIFNKFNQADTSTTRKYGGTGLGLTICRQLTEMMGGDISVDSVVGKGTSFVCYLPFALPDEKDLPALSTEAKSFKGQNLRVLVMDDNEISCEILKELLINAGFDVTVVQKAYLGLQLLDKAVLEEKPFDFIILDYVMPDMNGVEVATLIRQKPMFDDLKMILATSQPTRSDAEDIKFAGIKGYLIKPLRPLELLGIMALLQEAQEQKQSIDMVTRYTIRERRIGHKKENEKISYQNVNVLVAEDNPVNQEVMMGMLEDYGIKTTIARNGLEAIATLKKYTFDLVFMDCQMPEMDGFEATNIIRNSLDSDKKIIVIALTANVMKGDRDKCIAAGMDDYLAKPINELELEKILVKWLSSEKQSENNGVEYVSSARWNGNTMELTALNKTIIEKLRARMKDRFGKMLETFSQSANTLITRIENGLAEDNLTEASEAAHALKSSGQIGAMVLYNLCVTMEERARAGDKAAVQENVVLARAEYDRILNDIEILKA